MDVSSPRDESNGLHFPPEEPMSDVDIMQTTIANLQAAQSKAHEREHELEAELELALSKLAGSERETQEAKNSLVKAEENLNDKERRITNLQLQLQQHSSENAAKTSDLAELRNSNRDIATERDALQDELYSRQEEIKRLNEVAENLELALKRGRRDSGQTAMLEEELQAYKGELQRLRDGAMAERQKWDSERETWEMRFQQMESEHATRLEQVSAEALQVVDEQTALVEELINEERTRMRAEFDLQLDDLAQQLIQVEEAHKAEQKRWMADMSKFEENDGLALKLQGDIDALREVILELEENNAHLEEEKAAGLLLLQAKGDALRAAEEAANFIKQQAESTAKQMDELEEQVEQALAAKDELEAKYSDEISALMEQVSDLEREVREARMREEAVRDESAATVSRMEASFRVAMEEKAELEEKFNSVLFEAENNRSAAEIHASSHEDLIIEKERLQEEVEALQAKLDQAEQRSDGVVDTLGLESEVSLAGDSLQQAETDLAHALNEKNVLEQELLWTAGALEKLMNEMQVQQEANAALQEKLQALTIDGEGLESLEAVQVENDSLKVELDLLRKKLHGYVNGNEAELLERVQQLESDLREREQLISEYQAGIRGIEAELDAIQNAQLERDNALVERNDKILTLQEACHSANTQRDEALADMARLEAVCEQLKEENMSKENARLGLEQELEEVQTELDSIRRELSVSPGTATFTISGDVLQELELTKQQNELIQKELDSAKATIAKYKSELRAKTEEAKKWRQQLEENTIAVTQEIQEINDTITQIATDKAAAEERATQAETKTAEVLRIVESLEERLNNSQRELEKRAQRLKELLEARKSLQAKVSTLERKCDAMLAEKEREEQSLVQEARINLDEVRRLQERIDFLQQEHSAQLEATVSQLQDVRKASLEHQEEAERMARRYEHILAKKNKLEKRLSSMQAKLKRQNALLAQKKDGNKSSASTTSPKAQSARSALRSLASTTGVSEMRLADISSDHESEVSDLDIGAKEATAPSRTRRRAPLGVLSAGKRETGEVATETDSAEPVSPISTASTSGQKTTRALYDDTSVGALFAGAESAGTKSARPKRKPLGLISSRGQARLRVSPRADEIIDVESSKIRQLEESNVLHGKENDVGDEELAISYSKRPMLASPSTSLTRKRRARTAHPSTDLIAKASANRAGRVGPLATLKAKVASPDQPQQTSKRSRRPRKSISQAGMGDEDSQDCNVQ